MNALVACCLAAAAVLLVPLEGSLAHPHAGQLLVDGHSHGTQTSLTALDGIIGLEKSTVSFHAPADNSLPWGYVEGRIANHVSGYPVIIQIYQDGDAVHFAQADVGQDGSYEYRFRVLSATGEETVRIFDGDYTVDIYRVVYLENAA